MKIMPIQSIPGALAREDGRIKLPEPDVTFKNGGTRKYKTKWVLGVLRKSSKTARHRYYGLFYRGVNYRVHRLVCEAFHGPAPKGKNIVLHLNEDSTDNRAENIKWGTQKENLNAPGFVAYCKARTGENSPAVKGRKKRELRENPSVLKNTTHKG
jgi:hypothetical protein